jgi:hypothetical protein
VVALFAATLPSAGLAADGAGELTVTPSATGLHVAGQGWPPNSEWVLAAVRHPSSSELGIPDRVFKFRPDVAGSIDVNVGELRAASDYTVRVFPATELLPYVSPVTPLLDAAGLAGVLAAAESDLEKTQTVFGRSFQAHSMVDDRAHDYLTRLHATETGAVAAVWLSVDSRDDCQLRAASSLDGGRTFRGPADFTAFSPASCDVRWASAPLRGGLVGVVMTLGDSSSFILFDPATGSEVSRRALATSLTLGYQSAAVGRVDGSMLVATDSGSLAGTMIGGVSTWVAQSDGGVSRVGSIDGASGWSFAMRADEVGNIGLAWIATEATLLQQRARLMYTLSTDQGRTFAASEEIDVGVPRNLRIEGAAFSAGIFHFTVADYSSGDAYYVQASAGKEPQARHLCGAGAALMMPECSRGQYVQVVAAGRHVWLVFEGFSRLYDSQDERSVQYYAMESVTAGASFMVPYETHLRISTPYDATATIDGRAVLLGYIFFDDEPEIGMIPLFDPLALPDISRGIAETVEVWDGAKLVDLVLEAVCDGGNLVVHATNQGRTSLLSAALEFVQNGQNVGGWAPKTATHLAPGAQVTWNVGGPIPSGDFSLRPVAAGVAAGDDRLMVCTAITASTTPKPSGNPSPTVSDASQTTQPTPTLEQTPSTEPTSTAASEEPGSVGRVRSTQDTVRIPGFGLLGVVLGTVAAITGIRTRSRKD